MRRLPLLLAATLLSISAQAAERFVAGIPIPLRAEADSTNRKILQLLPVGEKVTIGEKRQNGFTQITTDSGITGWIPTRYLSETPPIAPGSSSAAQKQVQYELEINRLKSTVSSMQQERQILEAETQKLKESIHRAYQEVDTIRDVSSSALELEQQNTNLQNQLRTQRRQLEVLEQENAALRDRKERDWFMVGTLVTTLSIFSGFYLARSRRAQQRNTSRL